MSSDIQPTAAHIAEASRLIRGNAQDIGLHGFHVAICTPCLDGKGGICHTPGCLFIRSTAPDIPIRDRAENDGLSVEFFARVLAERDAPLAAIRRYLAARMPKGYASAVETIKAREALTPLDRGQFERFDGMLDRLLDDAEAERNKALAVVTEVRAALANGSVGGDFATLRLYIENALTDATEGGPRG